MEPILFMFYAVLIPSDTASCNTQCMQYSVSTTLTKSMLSHLYQTYNVNDLYYNLWATGQSTYPQSADPNLFAVGCTALHTFLEEKRVIYECINININSHINSQKTSIALTCSERTQAEWKTATWGHGPRISIVDISVLHWNNIQFLTKVNPTVLQISATSRPNQFLLFCYLLSAITECFKQMIIQYRVVKTARFFWLANREEKDQITG